MRGIVTALVALASGCVNLSPPSIHECAADESRLRVRCPRRPGRRRPASPDVNTPDVVRPDSGADARPDLLTDAAIDNSVDISMDMPIAPPIDAPPDRPPDIPPDAPPDRPIDTPRISLPIFPPTRLAVTCPSDSSLLVCLRLEGNLTDESSPAATLASSNISYETGVDAQAVRLGTSSLLRVNSGSGTITTSITLEAWLRVDRMPTSSQRAALFDEEGRIGVFLHPGGTVTCAVLGNTATATNALTTGQWSSVACTVQGASLTLWINGVQRGQTTTSAIPNDPTTTLGIGGNLPSGDPFEGLMDNIRIWNRARTAQEICDHAPSCP